MSTPDYLLKMNYTLAGDKITVTRPLTITGDVADGTLIRVYNGSLTIHGSVGENVTLETVDGTLDGMENTDQWSEGKTCSYGNNTFKGIENVGTMVCKKPRGMITIIRGDTVVESEPVPVDYQPSLEIVIHGENRGAIVRQGQLEDLNSLVQEREEQHTETEQERQRAQREYEKYEMLVMQEIQKKQLECEVRLAQKEYEREQTDIIGDNLTITRDSRGGMTVQGTRHVEVSGGSFDGSVVVESIDPDTPPELLDAVRNLLRC